MFLTGQYQHCYCEVSAWTMLVLLLWGLGLDNVSIVTVRFLTWPFQYCYCEVSDCTMSIRLGTMRYLKELRTAKFSLNIDEAASKTLKRMVAVLVILFPMRRKDSGAAFGSIFTHTSRCTGNIWWTLWLFWKTATALGKSCHCVDGLVCCYVGFQERTWNHKDQEGTQCAQSLLQTFRQQCGKSHARHLHRFQMEQWLEIKIGRNVCHFGTETNCSWTLRAPPMVVSLGCCFWHIKAVWCLHSSTTVFCQLMTCLSTLMWWRRCLKDVLCQQQENKTSFRRRGPWGTSFHLLLRKAKTARCEVRIICLPCYLSLTCWMFF